MFMLHIFNAYDTMEVHQPSNYHIVQEKKKIWLVYVIYTCHICQQTQCRQRDVDCLKAKLYICKHQ
jgi:predicted SprT family Zn-dependent metalloprotease